MKEEIVKEYLSRGKLLSPEELDMIMKGGSIQTQGIILAKKEIPRLPAYTIIKNVTSKKKEASVEDFARFYRSRYEKLRDIIVDRIQRKFVSINKLDFYRSEVFVIGMVRDIREKDDKIIVELEDMTASVPIIFDKEAVVGVDLDDVVAVKAISAKNVLFGKQIIFPDVPLRSPATGLGKVCVVSDLNLHEAPKGDVEKFFGWVGAQNFQYLIVAGNIGDNQYFEECVAKYCHDKIVVAIQGEKDCREEYPFLPAHFSRENIISLSNPSMIEAGGVKIMITRNFDITSLKKRYAGKTNTLLDEDVLVIDTIPDIVCSGSSRPQVSNYKSITIASSGGLLTEFRPVIIDLSTRETTQVQV